MADTLVLADGTEPEVLHLTYYSDPWYTGYKVSLPGDRDGDYVRLEVLTSEVRAREEAERRAEDALVFTCPHCGDPQARAKEPTVDVHAGATYTCSKCDGKVVLSAQTPEEYTAQFALVAEVGALREALENVICLVPDDDISQEAVQHFTAALSSPSPAVEELKKREQARGMEIAADAAWHNDEVHDFENWMDWLRDCATRHRAHHPTEEARQ